MAEEETVTANNPTPVEPKVVAGTAVLPKTGQMLTSINPYHLPRDRVEELGGTKELDNLCAMDVRFDNNHG